MIQPFRTLKRIMQLTIQAMEADSIAKARLEEAVFTSPGMLSLRNAASITPSQEKELLELLQIVSYMLQNSERPQTDEE